jgi:hypothetical protein
MHVSISPAVELRKEEDERYTVTKKEEPQMVLRDAKKTKKNNSHKG